MAGTRWPTTCGGRDIDISALPCPREVRNAKDKSAEPDLSVDYGTRVLYRQFEEAIAQFEEAIAQFEEAIAMPDGADLHVQILTLSQVDHAPIWETTRLYHFLEQLCKAARWDGKAEGGEPRQGDHERINSLGESKLCIALTPPTAPKLVQEALENSVELASQLKSSLAELASQLKPSSAVQPGDKLNTFIEDLRRSVRKVKEDLGRAKHTLTTMIDKNNDLAPGADPRSKASPRVMVLKPERLGTDIRPPDDLIERFDHLQHQPGPGDASKAALLRLASVFRRPRHVIALETVARDCGWNGGGTESLRSARRFPYAKRSPFDRRRNGAEAGRWRRHP